MRIFKAWLVFIVILVFFGAALYYVANLLPQPVYAVFIIKIMFLVALLVAGSYLGYSKGNKLFFGLLALSILAILPLLVFLLIMLPEYLSVKELAYDFLLAFFCLMIIAYFARAVYLHKIGENQE